MTDRPYGLDPEALLRNEIVVEKLGVPAMFTEFGADAYDARADREDADAQAEYLSKQWQEIYEQSWGKGRAGNAIGGFVFQWVDGWWKYKQEVNLDVHDTTATWPNDAYRHDFVAGPGPAHAAHQPK